MATANVTCQSCGQGTSFEHPDDHENPEIRWDCPNCGAVNSLEFPENRERFEARLREEASRVSDGAVAVSDVDSGAAAQAAGS